MPQQSRREHCEHGSNATRLRALSADDQSAGGAGAERLCDARTLNSCYGLFHGFSVTTPCSREISNMTCHHGEAVHQSRCSDKRSRSDLGSGACNRAHRRATTVSMARSRSAKAGKTWHSIHARRIVPCAESRLSMRRMPSPSPAVENPPPLPSSHPGYAGIGQPDPA
jgi:hypothetical protein